MHRSGSALRLLLNSLVYFPSAVCKQAPDDVGLTYRDLAIDTEDGERLHGWWMPSSSPSLGHLLLFHGNAGNVCDRLLHAELLVSAGFDVLLFDYRGYGRSTGSPSEQGTYRDARAAHAALLGMAGADDSPTFYLGESLGGAVALALALERPPSGLILQSAFASVREMARVHYPFIPAALVPDAYPSLRLIRGLDAPLLVLHGERDDIVPVSQARTLFEAAPGPKQMHVFPGVGHNDLVPLAGQAYAREIASWAEASV
ncbi:MAG: alpha/beta hydrolase [Actinomycetota bacterium]|nr:alpha/beta hydrolase [Actinomycetota bacterium]